MSTAKLRNWKVWVPALVVPMLLGGTVWGIAAHRKAQQNALPKELSTEALKAETDPHKVFEKVHQAMRQGNLSDEQRHQLFENARGVVEARIDQRMNTYFAAKTDDEKNALLDRDIEDLQKFMKQMQERQAQWQREHPGETPRGFFGRPGGSPGSVPSGNGEPSGSRASGGGPPGPSATAGGPPPGGGFRRGDGNGPTRQQRKMRSESRSPDQRAKHMAYFSALHARAQKRGITIPSFGGPH